MPKSYAVEMKSLRWMSKVIKQKKEYYYTRVTKCSSNNDKWKKTS